MVPSSLHPQKAFLGKDTVHGLTVCFVCLSVSSLDQGCDRVSSSWLLLSLERPLLHSTHTRWVQGEPLAVERGLRGLGPSRLRARGAPQRRAHTPLGDTGTGSAGSAPTSSALREHADGPATGSWQIPSLPSPLKAP